LDENEETAALAVHSRLLQLQYAWRLGMAAEEQERLAAEAEEIATRRGDLHSLALLRVATSVRPGIQHHADDWIAAVEESSKLADESGDLHLRVAVRAAGSYAFLSAGDFDRFDRALSEILELAGEDRSVGAGIVLGSPVAWALMGRAMVCRERGRFDEAEDLFEQALRIALEEDDPETASWIRSNLAGLLAIRGDVEAGLALARRNCELTDRIGDVFSRTVALAHLSWAQLAAEEPADSLASIEEAERVYREAMDSGGEMEGWRAVIRSQALRETGRTEEAIEVAGWAAEISRERGMIWTLPLALLALGRAQIASGRDGEALATLDEAANLSRDRGAVTLLNDVEAEREALLASRA
jgi:tetratricopeptide (TPR) repeat protein